MVLPEAETQRPSTPSFPPFANQFEELERVQTQHRAAGYFNDAHAPYFHAASPNNRGPLTIRNINPEPRDLPLPPSQILQTRNNSASSTPQVPAPEIRRPNRVPRATPYPDEVSLRPPHLRIRSPDMSNPSYHPASTPGTSNPHRQSPQSRPNQPPYHPSRPAPPPPSLPPSSSSPPPHTPTAPLPPRPVTHPPSPTPHLPLISIYALRVRPGDILAYGNKLNHGCTVTSCYPDERRPDLVLRGEEGVGGPVKLNGGIRIGWRDGRTGELLSQLFEGLEVLQVRRGKEEEEGEDLG